MLRRYELTDDEWNRVAPLLPPENSGKQGRPSKCNRTILNGIVWIARSGLPGGPPRTLWGLANGLFPAFVNGLKMASLIIFFVS
ncbi:MAG: transposase [Blautia faecis]